jgi:hypothetical protein
VNGARYAAGAHVAVGGYLAVDVTALYHQSQRHADHEQQHGPNRKQQQYYPGRHGAIFFPPQN